MDVALLIFLILVNALFAMSELAITSSRKARLQVMVEAGDSGAQAAMDLHDDPTKFLSVVQVGITSIGILNGIVGDAAFSAPFAHWLQQTFPLSTRAAELSATGMVVVSITFFKRAEASLSFSPICFHPSRPSPGNPLPRPGAASPRTQTMFFEPRI